MAYQYMHKIFHNHQKNPRLPPTYLMYSPLFGCLFLANVDRRCCCSDEFSDGCGARSIGQDSTTFELGGTHTHHHTSCYCIHWMLCSLSRLLLALSCWAAMNKKWVTKYPLNSWNQPILIQTCLFFIWIWSCSSQILFNNWSLYS